VIPRHGNFGDPRANVLRQVKNLHIKGKASYLLRLKHRQKHISPEGFETALGIGVLQSCQNPYKAIEAPAGKFAQRRLVHTNLRLWQVARANGSVILS
jgi:hypothetical protein